MSQQVSVLGNKKLLFAIGALAVVIVAILLGSSLLSNKNEAAQVKETDAAANEAIKSDASGNQILINWVANDCELFTHVKCPSID